MAYNLEEVKTKQTAREFLELPVTLYSDKPNWIRPLNKDIESVFDPSQNTYLQRGKAIRYILRDSSGEVVGRVAAFINFNSLKLNPQPTGGMGFFECIDNQQAANLLFDACRSWLTNYQIEAMDGPINFGARDRWWGLLVEGDYPPNYCMGYHHPYYKNLFENYGFKAYYHQYTYHRPVNAENINPIVWDKAKRIARNPAYQIKNISKRHLNKYADDFRNIYNQAWSIFSGVQPISKLHALALLRSLKPIMDEKIILFAYYNNKPIGFLIMIPDLNQVIRTLNGNSSLLSKLKLMYLLKVKKVCTKAIGLIYGTVPEHQGKGLEGALIKGLAEHALRKDFQYTDIELNWIGDFNPTMRKVAEQIGASVRKVHITYRYMFNPNVEVVPPKRVN